MRKLIRKSSLRGVIIVMMAMIIMAVSAPAAFALDVAPPDDYNQPSETSTSCYQIMIMDDADLLTDEEEQKLYEDARELSYYGNVVLSTVILDDWDYEGYAEDTYYYLFGNQPGVLFQIDMGNRKLTLSASTGMEDLIGSERDSIVDNIYKKATNEDYYGCASECFAEIMQVINGKAIAHQMKYIDNASYAIILAMILNFICVFATTRKRINRKRLLGELAVTAAITDLYIEQGKVTRRKAPKSSGGGGGHSGGGGFSGGGGGGFSGGSSSHGF